MLRKIALFRCHLIVSTIHDQTSHFLKGDRGGFSLLVAGSTTVNLPSAPLFQRGEPKKKYFHEKIVFKIKLFFCVIAMSHFILPAKNDIKNSFNRAASTYDEAAFLQREIGDRLLQRLDYIKLSPQRLLDLGCGTGYVTSKLGTRYPQAEIVALDLAAEMVACTRRQLDTGPWLKRLFGKMPARHYLCADAEHIPLAGTTTDLIFSNLALQWCNPENVFCEALRVLSPGGLLMFTTFGPDTLKELRAAFSSIDEKPHVNVFIDMHDLGDLLVHAGFADPVMDMEILTLTYSELKTLLQELKQIGARNVMPGRNQGLMGRQAWARIVQGYEKFRTQGKLPATYEVIYGHAWKPLRTVQKSVEGQQVIGLDEFREMTRKK